MARNPYFVPVMMFACSMLLALDILRVYFQVVSHKPADELVLENIILEVPLTLAYIFGVSASAVFNGSMDPGKYSMRVFGLFAFSVAIFYVIIGLWLPVGDHMFNLLMLVAIILIAAVGVFFVRRSYELKPLIPFLEPMKGF